MKKRIKNLNLFMLLSGMLGLVSCESTTYHYELTTTPEADYIYMSTDGDRSSTTGTQLTVIDDYGPDKSDESLFVDARTSDGWSNWPNLDVNFTNTKEELQTNNGHTHYDEYFTGEVSLTSPPVYLQLALNSWDDSNSDSDIYGGKLWAVKSVIDDNGQSLADDPDWGDYIDDRLQISGPGYFIIWIGKRRGDVEKDIFESITGSDISNDDRAADIGATGTYTIKIDPGKDSIFLDLPKYLLKFEIIHVDWENLTLKGSMNGKSGTLELIH